MDRSIKAGDVVQVVRGHVCDLGRIGTVIKMENYSLGWYCDCDHEVGNGDGGLFADCGEAQYWKIEWLKRIPSLEDLQTFRQTDETTA